MAEIPTVEAAHMERMITELLPEASFVTQTINTSHGSWEIEIVTPHKRLAIVWGPLSGFGGIDHSRLNNDPFAYCDEFFWSMDDARKFLVNSIT
jgi:hypothetical protein